MKAVPVIKAALQGLNTVTPDRTVGLKVRDQTTGLLGLVIGRRNHCQPLTPSNTLWFHLKKLVENRRCHLQILCVIGCKSHLVEEIGVVALQQNSLGKLLFCTLKISGFQVEQAELVTDNPVGLIKLNCQLVALLRQCAFALVTVRTGEMIGQTV